MIKPLFMLAAIGGVVTSTSVEDQAYFAILVETKVGRMVGMPVIDMSELPPGFKLPPEAMMFAGAPARVVNMRLWSPSIAPANATASVAPPAGLKQGPKLDLELYRPEPSQTTGGSSREFNPDANPNFTIKIYWGSSKTVKEGQPKVIEWKGITPEQQEAMRQTASQMNVRGGGGSYFYKPNWTTGYWPTKKQAGNIDKDASLVGKYTLTTNYTGNVEIEAPSNVNFLAPIDITAPNLENKVDLKKSISFKWKSIPNVLGQYASIFSMEGQNTMVIWSSSEVFTEGLMADMGFLQMAEVRDYVGKTMFMGSDRTSVDVPAGIFQNADFVMMNMVGYGPGAALDKAQPLPRIQTKTSLMLMLGGKKMEDIGVRPR
ncbi:MAG: hypothetical protein KF784_05745 [Fimbriimonadaceae bacterium]|nr:hypothetical protein [Fimbriimonadaceae bacterium]